jgi:hypothetical protein
MCSQPVFSLIDVYCGINGLRTVRLDGIKNGWCRGVPAFWFSGIAMHLSHYYRYLWQGPELVVITGDASSLWQGSQEYCRKHAIVSDASAAETVRLHLLAAAGLAAVSLPERESWGWTLALPQTGIGLFCATEPEGMVCACLRASRPEADTAVVQRQKEGSPLTQSHYTLRSADPVRAVEQYFEESAQMLVRLAVLDDGRGAFVQPLPGHGFGPLDGLTDAELVEQCSALGEHENVKLLDEVVLFYGCRCTEEMIVTMITALPAQQRAELWQDASSLTVNCPRCGRAYTITRA